MAFLWIDSSARLTSNSTVPEVSRSVKQIDGVTPAGTGGHFSDVIQAEIDKKGSNKSSPARLAYEQASNILKASRINLIASDVMTTPVQTLNTSQSLLDATTFFIELRYRHLPVVNSEGKLVGIISDRDIYKYYYQHTQATKTESPSVSDVAKSPVLVTKLDTPIKNIVRTLFEERIGAMPILDEENDLIGIITRSDILRVILEKTHFDLFV